MQICCAGEVMVEMSACDIAAGKNSRYQRGVGGDSYNTAVYLARAGLSVSYLTRLGDDGFSEDIIASMVGEGIGTELLSRIPGRQPGLYIIDTDATGERTFSYWRDQAPARELFQQPLDLSGFNVFYLTGITLAITRSGNDQLIALLQQLKHADCRVVLDTNYRPRLWSSAAQAQECTRAILPYCDTVFTTLEDDAALWGLDTLESSRGFYADFAVREFVARDNTLRAMAWADGDWVERQAESVHALDTTGAGDAFNGAYLATRLQGGDLEQSLAGAQALSARVVQHRGAILPR